MKLLMTKTNGASNCILSVLSNPYQFVLDMFKCILNINLYLFYRIVKCVRYIQQNHVTTSMRDSSFDIDVSSTL